MKLAILSAGAPRHGLNLCTMVQSISDSEGWGWQTQFVPWVKDGYDSFDFSTVDWCWWEGCFERVFEFMGQIEGPHHAARWIGTDLLQHRELVARGYPDPFGNARIHMADAPHLVQEAYQLTGLDVALVRSIPPETYQATPIQRWDNILCYVPTGREDFFRWSWILEVARDYPEIGFSILARQETPKEVTNVRAIQEVQGEEKRRLFESCFTYLRPVEHDGIGLTLVEMAQLGRYVFHSDTRIPFVGPARSVGEIEFGIDRILSEKKSPDPEVSTYYVNEYSYDKLRGDVEKLRFEMAKHLPISP